MSSFDPGAPASPSFRIGEVASITGVSEATLRMWERRYHFPCPTRTQGGQRQYSQHEVLEIQWVKMHLDEGLRVGRAIQVQHLSNRSAAVSASLHIPLPIIARPDPDVVALQSGLQ
ncbi:MAG TPA: MerR family transcriptional regulator, partial [Ktedonobacterales bacterium]|nr:MerR family transcriptional regulator [Ktedonobacterales bacterium]